MSDTSFSIYEAARPNTYRYQGHSATDKRDGWEADGSKYYNQSHDHDCQPIPIDYGQETLVSPFPRWPRYGGEGKTDRVGVLGWNPWEQDGGRIEVMYQAAGGPQSPVVALYAGAASRLIAGRFAVIGFYSGPKPDAGISLYTEHSGADNSHAYSDSIYHTIRFPFGIFVGTRKADLSDDVTIPHTAHKQYARHGGGLNLDKLLHWKLDYPDPKVPYGGMYMSKIAVARLIQRCRSDVSYFNRICAEDGFSRDVWEMWRDSSGGKAREMAKAIHAEVGQYVEEWANQRGYMSGKFGNQPWLLPGPKLDRIDQLLGNDALSAAEKTRLKADAALLGNWLWDFDVYPVKAEGGLVTAGVSMGSANMPGAWLGIRDSFTWFLSSHPVIATHLSESLPNTYMINDFGACFSCPGYTLTITPPLNAIARREMLGLHDWQTDPKLSPFRRMVHEHAGAARGSLRRVAVADRRRRHVGGYPARAVRRDGDRLRRRQSAARAAPDVDLAGHGQAAQRFFRQQRPAHQRRPARHRSAPGQRQLPRLRRGAPQCLEQPTGDQRPRLHRRLLQRSPQDRRRPDRCVCPRGAHVAELRGPVQSDRRFHSPEQHGSTGVDCDGSQADMERRYPGSVTPRFPLGAKVAAAGRLRFLLDQRAVPLPLRRRQQPHLDATGRIDSSGCGFPPDLDYRRLFGSPRRSCP